MIVDMALYEKGVRRPGEVDLEQMYEACRRPECFAWIGLHEPTEEEFDSVRREFGLHELAVEDAIEAHQRPKLEVYRDSLFMVLKTARYVEGGPAVETGEIQVFIGEGFIITVRHGETKLHDVRLQLEQRPEFLRLGPGAALHAIIDRVVDDYGPVVEALDRDVRNLEAEVFSERRGDLTRRIYGLKREVLELYDAVAPLNEPLERLERLTFPLIPKKLWPYFRDVKDHVLRYIREVDGFRELLTSILAANLTQASVRQNEDVRLGCDYRRPDADHRHLRHELRTHARAGLDRRLPARHCLNGSCLLRALPQVQALRVALESSRLESAARRL